MRQWIQVIVLTLVAVLMIAFGYEILQLQINNTQNSNLNEKVLYQISSYDVMASGDYTGKITYGELAKHGDFGIGAFQGMNGEMLAIDGVFYQIPTTGTPIIVDSSLTTPYAMVSFFEVDYSLIVQETMNYTELKAFIDNNLPTLNGIFSVKIHGNFSYIKARSVPFQTEPYPQLSDVIANQTVFTLTDEAGTIVGYRCPSYMSGINVAGYHCHFITDDKTAGGHMLDFIAQNVTIEIDHIQKYYVEYLP